MMSTVGVDGLRDQRLLGNALMPRWQLPRQSSWHGDTFPITDAARRSAPWLASYGVGQLVPAPVNAAAVAGAGTRIHGEAIRQPEGDRAGVDFADLVRRAC
jgi:hypothetical protein